MIVQTLYWDKVYFGIAEEFFKSCNLPTDMPAMLLANILMLDFALVTSRSINQQQLPQ